MTCPSDAGTPVKVKLTDVWTGKASVFPSQKAASRFLERYPKYVNHCIRGGWLAMSRNGTAYDVEVVHER